MSVCCKIHRNEQDFIVCKYYLAVGQWNQLLAQTTGNLGYLHCKYIDSVISPNRFYETLCKSIKPPPLFIHIGSLLHAFQESYRKLFPSRAIPYRFQYLDGRIVVSIGCWRCNIKDSDLFTLLEACKTGKNAWKLAVPSSEYKNLLKAIKRII